MESIQEKTLKAIQENRATISDTYVEHKFEGTPFTIKMYDVIFGNNGWNYSCYDFFKEEDGIIKNLGRLFRNYGRSSKICQPFLYENKWLILFSDMYTRVSVYDESLKLLNHTKSNFCPVEIYVPRFKKDKPSKFVADNSEFFVNCNGEEEEFYPNFGFISGCHWGDDSSMKLRTLDLSDIDYFSDNDTYGYLEIPYSLRKSILFDNRTYPAPKNVRIISLTCIDDCKRFGE